jgi:hypothetical protein
MPTTKYLEFTTDSSCSVLVDAMAGLNDHPVRADVPICAAHSGGQDR